MAAIIYLYIPSEPQGRTLWQKPVLLLVHAFLMFARNGNILLEGLYYADNDYSCIRGIKQLAIKMKISGNQQSILN